jgi:hypothetical protein
MVYFWDGSTSYNNDNRGKQSGRAYFKPKNFHKFYFYKLYLYKLYFYEVYLYL